MAQAIGYLARCAARAVAAGADLRVWASLIGGQPRISIGSACGEPAAGLPPPGFKIRRRRQRRRSLELGKRRPDADHGKDLAAGPWSQPSKKTRRAAGGTVPV